MKKFTSMLALAAVLALAAPQAMAGSSLATSHKSVSTRSAKRVTTGSARKAKKPKAEAKMSARRIMKKKVVSHPKSVKRFATKHA